ncbi:alpha/beta fold hydrolase [Caenispirillum salinarum]|uniref:alpha/beta fold hydrolase n=1 Tax=Caenispirillum salinarum TaxID=859058 RepID=UPI00384EFE89
MSTITEGVLTAAGHRLEYRWHGPAPKEASTLVFLHEGLGCRDLWKDVPADLSARLGMGALVYSRPGYGGSSGITLPRSTDYLTPEALEVLPAVLDATGVERAVLIGHSDGGSIALIAAGRGNDPRIRAIVTEAAHVFVEDVTLAGISEARTAWETTNLREKLARWHGANTDTAFHGWNDTWLTDAYAAWNIEDVLPGVTVPSLVIQGEGDQYGTEAQVDAIVSGVSGPAEKLMVPDCGHVPHFEQRARVLDAIAAFVEALRT